MRKSKCRIHLSLSQQQNVWFHSVPTTSRQRDDAAHFPSKPEMHLNKLGEGSLMKCVNNIIGWTAPKKAL